ncbi:hypothetical protein ABZ512_14300 [Nocardiopsis dassonvillei]|uniref:hypothetical protein n=1 Tax=Nocardiopsis dassonvillei TaxID=2014 RepID=UPI0033C8ED3F
MEGLVPHRPSPDFVERLAKARFLLPLGYKEFPENPTSHDWRTLIVGLGLVPLMMLAVAVWTGLSGQENSAVGFTVIAAVFSVVWILPKIVLWTRVRKRDQGSESAK